MHKNNLSTGRLLFIVLVIVFFWVAVNHLNETKEIFSVLIEGKWYWVTLAVLCQLIFYPFYARFVEFVFNIFKVDFKYNKILPIYIASKFTDIVLPIATVGKIAIFVRNGKKNDITPINIGIGMAFTQIIDLIAFVSLSLIIIYFLYLFGEPRTYLLITSLILAVIVISFTALVVATSKSNKPFTNTFKWIAKKVARIAGQKRIDFDEVRSIFNEVAKDLDAGGKKIWPAFGIGVCTHLINIITLGLIYLAFSPNFNILAVLATYIAGLLFTVISITPQGVGVAETIMVTTLHSFGMDLSVSAVITMAYRGLLYWLPLFPGFYFFSHLEFKTPERSLPVIPST
jgi:uncharacterized protein (TIRG00374 family)